MSDLAKARAWGAAFALICLVTVPMAWVSTQDGATHWFLAAWIALCLGVTWLQVHFNWRSDPQADDYPYNVTWDKESKTWVSASTKPKRQP